MASPTAAPISEPVDAMLETMPRSRLGTPVAAATNMVVNTTSSPPLPYPNRTPKRVGCCTASAEVHGVQPGRVEGPSGSSALNLDRSTNGVAGAFESRDTKLS